MLAGLLVLSTLLALVYGHGYMIYPAQRSSLWRYGIWSPVNLDDNELFCGGLKNLWTLNGGKCGECGDPYQDPRPCKHEAGGMFGKGTIFKEFKSGEIVDVEVELTSNHKGWFEFRLCPLSSPGELVTQACLDQHLLHIADGVSGTRYFLPNDDAGKFTVPVKLPEDMICDQCVMQWWWNAGHKWNDCGNNGTWSLGCGPQETYVNCADIKIGNSLYNGSNSGDNSTDIEMGNSLYNGSNSGNNSADIGIRNSQYFGNHIGNKSDHINTGKSNYIGNDIDNNNKWDMVWD